MENDLNSYLPDQSAPPGLKIGAGLRTSTPFRLMDRSDVRTIFRKRTTFSHKGSYGHALLIAGAAETMGAAMLASMGCIYAGAGLTSVCIPESGLTALNGSLPEVMFVHRDALKDPKAWKVYNAVGIGPGLKPGAKLPTADIEIMAHLFSLSIPLIVDADALNILSVHPHLMDKLPAATVLSPHVKEFDRLFGSHDTWWSRLETARTEAKRRQIVIVLKNAYTFIVGPNNDVAINPTGNPAMAQGGMGDVLTGVITAFLAQHYSSFEAAVLGCYFHGLAGDELAKTRYQVNASLLATHIPATIKNVIG